MTLGTCGPNTQRLRLLHWFAASTKFRRAPRSLAGHAARRTVQGDWLASQQNRPKLPPRVQLGPIKLLAPSAPLRTPRFLSNSAWQFCRSRVTLEPSARFPAGQWHTLGSNHRSSPSSEPSQTRRLAVYILHGQHCRPPNPAPGDPSRRSRSGFAVRALAATTRPDEESVSCTDVDGVQLRRRVTGQNSAAVLTI